MVRESDAKKKRAIAKGGVAKTKQRPKKASKTARSAKTYTTERHPEVEQPEVKDQKAAQ